ncbi:MAG: Gamma-glutamyltranspeptidase @ Glutathione hydrolase [uncultured Chloroflexi bacterium]|uniref:Glutathione hydrolase proenzyme n=1 Tax=uncultured Chloroflexota bacterium TaxID=166587 RepID=A0A6J4IUK7_9CHLR|nr:MAG: Gamma-glutamyltranspeptidase @ Glutathione hydrolase [uncultured Chloroflexota bacterium]
MAKADTLAPSAPARYASRGMVASASPAAAAVGLRVLMDGGNAFDAAVATALVEGLTLPASCGLGGDMFAVLYDARSRSTYAINGSGVAAGWASRDYYVSRGHTQMPLYGVHSVSVPGAPDAYWTLHQRFGSRPWSKLVEPAITCAEDGIALSAALARSIGNQKKFLDDPASTATFLAGGQPPEAGAVFRRPDYARSLRTLAQDGPEPFYRGSIARETCTYLQAQGGLLEEADFAGHATEVYAPLRTTYRDVEVCSTAPPSQGMIILEWLNLLESFDLAGSGFGTAETLHLMAETKKLAFADRLRYAGDPRFIDVPLNELLSKSFAARRLQALDRRRAATQVEGALPEALHGDTSSFCVADGQGNMVSFIHSLSAGFGSGVTAGETGILLNNRAGRGFTLEEGHPNVIQGGKRTMHTLNCYLLLRDGQPYAVGGTPGGDQQPQWNVQTITNVVDFGQHAQQAADAPRWYSFPGTDPVFDSKPFDVRLESRFGPDTVAGLVARGHQVVDIGPWGSPGAIQLIQRLPNGVLAGGSDSRAGGIALGW